MECDKPAAMSGTPAEGASFEFFAPSSSLCPFVRYFYVSDVPAAFMGAVEAKRLPELEPQLVFVIEHGRGFPGGIAMGGGFRATLFLQAAHLQSIDIPGSIREAVGVALHPAGIHLAAGRAATELVSLDRVALEELLGPEARVLLERLVMCSSGKRRRVVMDNWLHERAMRLAPPSLTAVHAVRLLQAAYGDLSVEVLAEMCGFTSRTLRRALIEGTGLGPKQLSRIMRLRRALDLIRSGITTFSDAAVTSAFADQAHMVREFRQLLGQTPAILDNGIRDSPAPRATNRDLVDTGLLILPKPQS